MALVGWLHEDALRRERVRVALKAMPDFARALARLAAQRGGPRDLALLRDGLSAAVALQAELVGDADRPPLLETLLPRLGGHEALVAKLTQALVASPPLDASKGGYIAEGYDAALDSLRAASSDGRRAIAALESRYRDATGSRFAQDPPQCGARLSYRGVGAARRPADGAGFRASPTARRWPGWSASIRPTSTPKPRASSKPAGMRSPPKPPTPRS